MVALVPVMIDEDVDLQSWGWTDLCVSSASSYYCVFCRVRGVFFCSVSACCSSYFSLVSDSEKEQPTVSFDQTGAMSRRSLRIDDGLLDRSLPHSSASFSVGGGSWRSSRSLNSRRSQQHSVSCSESLLHTPRKPASLHNSSLHSMASDASLLSSLLDESSVHEATVVDNFWGLDHDLDPKENTILAEQSSIVANSTLIGSENHCAKHPVQTLSRVYCKDCELHSNSKESASSKYTSSLVKMGPGGSHPGDSEGSTIYGRDRNRKSRIGLLFMWDSGVNVCWRAAAAVISLLTVVYQQLLLQKPHDVTDALQLWLDSSVLWVRRAAASLVSVLIHSWQLCQGSKVTEDNIQTGSQNGAQSRHCGVMSLKEPHSNGSLCQRVGDAFRWLCRRWQHKSWFPLRLLIVILLLLLFGLCWFGPAGLQSVFLAVHFAECRTALSNIPGLSSVYGIVSSRSQSADVATVKELKEVQPYVEPLYSPPPQTEEKEELGTAGDSERLLHLERSLAALWDHVEVGGRQAEQRHGEVLQLYTELRQQQLHSAQSSSDGVEPWLNSVLDHQLSDLRRQLDEERQQREQMRQQELLQHRSQSSRLDQLELQLQTLVANTQEVQRRHEAATGASSSPTTLPAAFSVGVDQQSHDALLAEVKRLEAALDEVRRVVEGLSKSQDGCRQLSRIQQLISVEVSAQVQEQVRSLVYGNQLTPGGNTATLPESLLQWLSQRYVSSADLQAALASLEQSLLQNISMKLAQQHNEGMDKEAVLHTAGHVGATVTLEDVHVMVKNALRLFSQDQTGMADFALESGGGSILSTRCSETYETKAALLSLFSIPLWYFSQSPRAVIQPDVHPGNCWAFRGSKGFLVIRLSMRILPTAFTLEHIHKALAPSGTLRSAPQEFSVYGLDDEHQEKGKLLGTYTYDEDGEALQTFPVTEENDDTFQIIEVQILSNWGHKEYTCMYRFRVHGTPSSI
ncbi:SUN domain-containing protein 1-like isoform X2 [Parambassis ranga]|uniref:SUN domain-containing protein 1-like isoform X2 n=1 Tax=Parambassis ranga TaxID=210632 RepID=A0A6P7KED5_9TELE|nr:SUN domain-containing protein 1-like isoform X2 [Parambassis ranga]